MYLLPTTARNIGMMPKDKFGIFLQPRNASACYGVRNGYKWALDNDAFNNEFSMDLLFTALEKMLPYQESCLFVTVPDVICNALATLDKYRYWAWRIKVMGYPVAFVAQDGQESFALPPEFDWLFVGGSTEFKESLYIGRLINGIKKDGKSVHVGRVNSERRLNIFKFHNVDTVDGTDWIRGPNKKKGKYLKWMSQNPLFTLD